MKNYYTSCILGVCMAIALQFKTSHLYATHAQGADISYQCLGGNQYRITVSFYRDCAGVAAPGSVTVDLNSASCGESLNLNLTPVPGTGQEVSPVCATMNTTCTGGSYPGVQEWQYSGVITLPASCTDWVFSFALCCRNNAITNINTPGSDDIYVEANLDNLNYPCNNSPVFSNPPVPFICVGQTYCFNHGANDADGDSLVYSLITPMTSPTTTVTYLPGWTSTQPLTSSPAVSIDPLTGDICMTPTNLEVTVMAVEVFEYRSGVLIGSVIRDIQVRVINCTNTLPTLSGINGTNNFMASVCAGNTLTFNVFSADEDPGQILTMTWNNAITGATFTTAGSPYPTGTFTWTPTAADITTVPYCFTVTVTDDACPFNGSQTMAFCITVSGLNVNVTPSDANCGASNGSATSAVSGGTAPYNYNWSSGSTADFDTGIPAGNYTLTVADATGCSSTVPFTIGPGTAPGNLTTTPVNVDCYGNNNGSITANLTGGGPPPTTYAWSTGASGSTITGLGPGVYIVVATTSGGCTTTDTVTITSPAAPLQLNFNKTDVTCGGLNNGSATAIVTGGTPGYTLLWSTMATTSTITGLAGGTYSCTATDMNSCTTTKSVTINEPLPITVSSATIQHISCNGLTDGEATLNVSGGTGVLTTVWYTTPSQTGLHATNLPAGSTGYYIYDANGCTISSNVMVTQPSALTLAYNVTDVTCNGASNGSVQVNVGGGTMPYVITVNGNLISNGGTLTGFAPGMYSINVSDGNGCTMAQTVSISEPLPVSLITAPDQTICPGDNITIYAYASGGTGVYSYTWNNGLGNNDSHIISPTMNTTYTVQVTDQNGCTSMFGNTDITVNDINSITLTVNGEQPVCAGESITLSAAVSNGTGTYTYNWNGGQFFGAGPHTFYPTTSTNYTVTVTDVCGNSITENIPVTVNPLPTVTIPSVSASACGNVSLEFENTSTPQAGDEFLWSINGVAYFIPDPTHVFDATGNYPITLTVTNSYGCSTTSTANANVQIFPQAVAVIDAVTHTAGEFQSTIQFINASLFANTFQWNFGDGSSSTQQEPEHFFDGVGTYPITMIANNQYGCADTVTMEITIHPEHTLYVPNAFTPDGDGLNDVFSALGSHIEEFEMMIFNRWGEMIFQTNSMTYGWDGTFKGDVVKEDVYVYKIKYKTNESEVLSKEGHITLLK